MTSGPQNITEPFRENVLIVDDDSHIREVIRFALRKAGYQTCEAADGQQALDAFYRQQPDIVILDILMPELDGNDVCKEIRRESDIPIIFLSSMDDEVDKIVGLELGADDYVTKPFSPRELVARVKAILKRSSGKPKIDRERAGASSGVMLIHGNLSMDVERVLVTWNGKNVSLTATEFSMLQTMIGAPGKVFSRDELLARMYDDVMVSDRTIDSHIRKIRRKFEQVGGEPIETVRGIGYKLGPC